MEQILTFCVHQNVRCLSLEEVKRRNASIKMRKQGIIRRAARFAGSKPLTRMAKMVPLGGSVVVIAFLAKDIRNKGFILGSINSGFDVIPFLGLTKNVVEIFTGDLIPDKRTKALRGRI